MRSRRLVLVRRERLDDFRDALARERADNARLRAAITYAVGDLVPGVSPHGVLSDALITSPEDA